MRFDLISDIHLENFEKVENLACIDCRPMQYWDECLSSPGSEVLVIAGDIHYDLDAPTDLTLEFFELAQSRYARVICVLGNHDYWTTRSIPCRDIPEKVRLALPGVELLENSVTEIDGLRVFAGTFWSPIKPDQAVALDFMMPDFKFIRWSAEEKFSSERFTELHTAARKALDAVVGGCPGEPIAVITHHAPSHRCTHWDECIYTQCFCCEFDRYLEEHREVCLWVHGHLHESCDFRIGTARIVCSAHGCLGRERKERGYRPVTLSL